MYTPERLHAVRIAAKKLRYGLEIAAEAACRPAAPLVRTMKRVQDTLGRLHDLQVLQTHVAAVQAHAARPRAVPTAASTRWPAALEDECRHLHGRYVALSPALRDALRRQLGERRRRSCARPRRPAQLKMALTPTTPRPRPPTPRGHAGRSDADRMATLELYLIRHGVAAERGEEYPDDSKRPLTSAGIARLRKEAKALDALGVGFDQIITSPLVRTRQTADVFAETLKSKPSVTTATRWRPPGPRRR